MKNFIIYTSLCLVLNLLPITSQNTPYLSYFTSTTFTTNEGWTIVNLPGSVIYSDCNSYRIFGGKGIFGSNVQVMKYIQLPPHYQITLTFSYWKIDSWDNEKFIVYIDQSAKDYQTSASGSSCSNTNQSPITETITQNHIHSSIFICFTTDLNESIDNESWGIRDIKLYISQCPPGCYTCTSDTFSECLPYILIYSSMTTTSLNDGWTSHSVDIPITQCGGNILGIDFLGGYNTIGNGDIILKSFSLPSHTLLKIQMKLVLLDQWNDKALYIKIDGQNIQQIEQKVQTGQLNFCGDSLYKDVFYNFEYILPHKNDVLYLEISTNLDQAKTQQSFGLREVLIYSYSRFSDCGNGQLEYLEQCDDGNLLPFDGCFNCQYSCIEQCSLCLYGICLDCQSGWEYNILDFNCIIVSNDNLYQYSGESTQILQTKEYNICSINCLNCQQDVCWLCDDGYILNRDQCQIIGNDYFNKIPDSDNIDDKVQISNQSLLGKLNIKNLNDITYCQDECAQCIKGICIECKEGWEIYDNQCKIKCGEQMTISFNQCNQSENNIEQYGLSQCKSYYSTKISIPGWHIDEKSNCMQTCNDITSQQLTYYNQCSNDSDYYDKEGCLECKQQCIPYCLVCKIGYCYQCMESFMLIDQNCEAICGDGLIALDQEECEDLNDIPYDGCFECHYQCRPNCQQCFEGVCYDECKDGYHMINDECYSICGDGQLSDIEECDDGNDVKEDGCYKCKYFCPLNCDVCEKGKCQECETGYQLLKDKNFCQPICGDGLILTQECDDKNTQNGDGCSDQCEIEDNYVCKNFNTTPSLCTFVEQPQLILKFIEEKDSIQYVSLTFSQEVLVDKKVDFSQKIKPTILNMNKDDYTIKLIAINEPKEESSFVEYSIQILFNAAFDEQPELDVLLLYPIYNIDDAELFNYEEKVKLKLPKYINEQQKSTAETMVKLNTYTINSMGVVAVVVLIFGNPLLFGSVLEVLQSQSYLRFININFPSNLNTYFESSNSISIQPILDYFNFLSMFKSVVGDNYVESNQKFKQYEVNADLLTNISGQIFQIILLLSSYYFCIGMTKLINLIQDKYLIFVGQTLTVQIFKFQRKCLRYSKKFDLTLFKLLLKANSWDLLLTSFLQISASQTKSFRSQFCNLSAYIILGSFVYLIIIDLNLKFIKIISMDCIWKSKYDSFTTLKKLVYISVLVIFQNCQELQIMLLSFISNLYLIYVFKYYPFNSKIGFINVILQEGILFLFVFTSISFWDIVTQYLSYEKLINLGWLQMALLSLVLLVNLLGQVKEIFLILKHFFLNNVKCKCKKQESKEEQKQNINSSQRGAILGSSVLQHTPQSISDLIPSPKLFNPNQVQITFAPGQQTPNFQNSIQIQKQKE